MKEQDNWACITGATSGIGASFAKKLALQGYNLLITGRRKGKIQSLAQNLTKDYAVKVKTFLVELSDKQALTSFISTIQKMDNLEILINNAGFGKKGLFHIQDFRIQEQMIKVHCLAPMQLTHAVLPQMVNKGRGAVINVSSTSAFSPFPSNAIYSASKDFLINFSESIYLELRGTGVKIQALCPGITRTEFHQRMGLDQNRVYKKRGLWKALDPDKVVDISLGCLKKEKVICVPGLNNKIIRNLTKILPRWILYRKAPQTIKKRL